jgi:hypothetical protein
VRPAIQSYEVTLEGACPTSLRALLDTRYDLGPVDAVRRPSALIIEQIDQASLRAVLLLLWDAGLDLRSVAAIDANTDV